MNLFLLWLFVKFYWLFILKNVENAENVLEWTYYDKKTVYIIYGTSSSKQADRMLMTSPNIITLIETKMWKK